MSSNETRPNWELGAMVEYDWSHSYKRMYPLHQPDLVEKAIKTANWAENRATQVFLTEPVKYEDATVESGQRVWFTRALLALTREEVVKLYDSLLAGSKACLETGGDFTSPDVRAHHPHIYGETGK